MAIACALPLLWPGDVSFHSDEPNLIAAALRANAAGVPAQVGLYGSFGVPYGPLPTQVYQLLLLLTHDPVVVAALRAGLSSVATAAGLLWLSRTLRLTPWFVPIVLVSPHVWHSSRMLWDNTFAIPVGALLLASYAGFLNSASGRSLVATIACGLALLSIHLMTAPLVAAVGLHLLWRHRPAALWAHRRGVLAVLAVACASSFGYVVHGASRAAARLAARPAPTAMSPGTPLAAASSVVAAPATLAHAVHGSADRDRLPRGAALAFPLYGGRILTGDTLPVHLAGFGPLVTRGIDAARVVSRAGHLLVWTGIGLTAFGLWHRRRRLAAGGDGPRDAVVLVALIALALQMTQAGVMRVAPYTHYFNGTAMVFVLFAWLAVDALRAGWLRAGALAACAASLGLLTLASLWQVHRDGGDRGQYGPTLANQVAVARAAAGYADAAVATDVAHYRKFPHGLWALRSLAASNAGEPARSVPAGHRLTLRYRASDPSHGRVELVEAADDAAAVSLPSVPLQGEAGAVPPAAGGR